MNRTTHLQVRDGGCKAKAKASAIEAARKSLRSNSGRVGRFLALRQREVVAHG